MVRGLHPVAPSVTEYLRDCCLNVGLLFRPTGPASPAKTDLTAGLAFGWGLPGVQGKPAAFKVPLQATWPFETQTLLGEHTKCPRRPAHVAGFMALEAGSSCLSPPSLGFGSPGGTRPVAEPSCPGTEGHRHLLGWVSRTSSASALLELVLVGLARMFAVGSRFPLSSPQWCPCRRGEDIVWPVEAAD